VTAVYRKPSEYRAGDAGLVILDRFIPPQRPYGRFHLDRAAGGRFAHPGEKTVENVPFAHWDSAHPGGRRSARQGFQARKGVGL
jgi:hypothetical protein